MDIKGEVLAAARRVDPYVRRTPVEFSHLLGKAGNCRVHLKLENLQRTGSFKFRGAMNKLLSLSESDRGRGVVAASTGNHGAAVACGATELGCPATIFAPTIAAPSKLASIRTYGATIELTGDDCILAEAAARRFATANGITYISPYNDPVVVAGQGTAGLEIEQQVPNVDVVIASVGGGGLIAGVGGYLKAVVGAEVIGASPRNSAVLHHSLEAGEMLDLPSEPTLSDGTAGGMEQDSITFELCRDVIDDFVLVSEDEIREALRLIVSHHHMLIEGAAAVTVAAFLAQGKRFAGKDVVLVLCGANIDADVLKGVL